MGIHLLGGLCIHDSTLNSCFVTKWDDLCVGEIPPLELFSRRLLGKVNVGSIKEKHGLVRLSARGRKHFFIPTLQRLGSIRVSACPWTPTRPSKRLLVFIPGTQLLQPSFRRNRKAQSHRPALCCETLVPSKTKDFYNRRAQHPPLPPSLRVCIP